MSNYGWYVVKCLGYMVLVGTVAQITGSVWALLALLLMPVWGEV